jgi:hypothetical protein
MDHRFSLQGSIGRRSSNQFAQIVHHQVRSMVPKFLSVALTRNTDHKTEVPVRPSLDPRYGVLDHDRPLRFDPKKLCGQQEHVWRRLSGQVLLMERIAVDQHLEDLIQLGRPYDGRAVLARGDHGHLLAAIAELVYEPNASFVRLHTYLLNYLVDQFVFAVPKLNH